MRGLGAARTAVMIAVAAIDADIRRLVKGLRGLPPADDNPGRRAVDRARILWPQSMIPRASVDRETSGPI